MLPASPPLPLYRCPGEAYDILRPVHLARLAAGYAACRNCRHRSDRADAVFEVIDTNDDATDSPLRSLLTGEGVRGVFLNELKRSDVAHLAGAFASCLWETWGAVESPPNDALPHPPADGETGEGEGFRIIPSGAPGPLAVLAHDERPASPGLAVEAATALRRMGCQVVDLGVATRPCFWFAIEHLHAAGGVHVTGSGCDPAWAGLDFMAPSGEPCSAGGVLDSIAARHQAGYTRPTRRPGMQRSFAADVPYEAGLWQHFHALRPLKVVLGCAGRLQRDLLLRIFRRQGGRAVCVDTPLRTRDFDDDHDPDLVRVARAVRDERADLGLLIDDDGQKCALVDDRGRRVAPLTLLRLLACRERDRHPGRLVAIGASPPTGGLPDWDDQCGGTGLSPLSAGTTPATMARSMRQPGVLCGVLAHRYWFADHSPACDAVLTLVKLWQLLSTADTPLSELVDQCA